MADVTEHKKCICVEFGNTNNNKVWQYTLYSDGNALTEWGRVGQGLQSKTTSHSAALKKWREKTNPNNKPDKRYTEVKTADRAERGGSPVVSGDLNAIAKKQIIIKNPVLSELIDFLVKTNAHNIYQASGGKIQYDTSSATFKTPLGVIVPELVQEARNKLVSIADYVNNKDWNNTKMMTLLNEYLRLIPHDVGMSKISPKSIFPSLNTIQQENDLLDGLETSFNDITTSPKTKNKQKKSDEPKVFSVEIDIVTDDNIITWIKNLYQRTRKSMHQANSYSVKKVYTINIDSVKNAYEEYGKKINHVQQLWHGTKASNLLSILKGGLIIPPSSSSHVTGRMFGNGVYFSDISTKALNYATNYWSKGGRIDRTFMFLADVAMGKSYVSTSYCDWKGPRDGFDSTFAKGGTGSGVQNNEMIVYRTDQVNLVYLVEFSER